MHLSQSFFRLRLLKQIRIETEDDKSFKFNLAVTCHL